MRRPYLSSAAHIQGSLRVQKTLVAMWPFPGNQRLRSINNELLMNCRRCIISKSSRKAIRLKSLHEHIILRAQTYKQTEQQTGTWISKERDRSKGKLSRPVASTVYIHLRQRKTNIKKEEERMGNRKIGREKNLESSHISKANCLFTCRDNHVFAIS